MSSQPGAISHILIFAAVMAAIIASLILFVRALIYFDQRGKRKPKGEGGRSGAARPGEAEGQARALTGAALTASRGGFRALATER